LGEQCPLVQAAERLADSGGGDPAKTAVWDLRVRPTTFDFAAWLVVVKSIGCERVHFVDGDIATTKYPAEIAWRRFKHILKPLCQLIGLPYQLVQSTDGICPAYHYGTVANVWKNLGRIEKYPMLPWDRQGYYTVTLRESFRNPYRNASEDWIRVINTLQQRGERVMVLRDCEATPIPIEQRMRIYANARINLGASNGPFALCHFSDAPYLTFNMIPREHPEGWIEHHAKTGFPVGSQFDFRNERQKLVWEHDDYERIMGEIDAL